MMRDAGPRDDGWSPMADVLGNIDAVAPRHYSSISLNPEFNPHSHPIFRGLRNLFELGPFLSWQETQETMERRMMDWNRVEGNWKQLKGKVKEQWGKLTDDDLTVINGSRDQLEGKIQERYGLARDRIKSDVDAWYRRQNLTE
jgi:uncharacterized protein YjbJ (UPF0337 family)